MKLKETLRGIIREEITKVLTEDVKAELKSKLERLPIVRKYDLQIEDKIRTFTNRNTGKKKYVVFISYPLSEEMPYNTSTSGKDSGGEIISKAIKRVFGREYDVDYSFINQRQGKYTGPHSEDGKRITVEFEFFEKGY